MTKVDINQLVAYCDDLLAVKNCRDYCPNGLQVQGKRKVSYIISGVTACQELITRARQQDADAVLVHHGYFWRGEDARVIGMKYERIKLLLDAGINLIAYHLPLDIHNELGNNAYLGKILGIDTMSKQVDLLVPEQQLGFIADLPKPLSKRQLFNLLSDKLGREPLDIPCIESDNKSIKRIAWCSGAAQDFIEQAKEQGADCYLSGEVSERTFHFVKENEIDYFAIGHHYSETGGVQLLGEHLAQQFGIKHKFIDIPNPI